MVWTVAHLLNIGHDLITNDDSQISGFETFDDLTLKQCGESAGEGWDFKH